MLSANYPCVIANPPYMGTKGMNSIYKSFAAKYFSHCKSDVFAMFIDRLTNQTKKNGFTGLMTPFVWMFLSSYTALREQLIRSHSIVSLVHPQYHTMFESAAVPICTFVIHNARTDEVGEYFDLRQFYGADHSRSVFVKPWPTANAVSAILQLRATSNVFQDRR